MSVELWPILATAFAGLAAAVCVLAAARSSSNLAMQRTFGRRVKAWEQEIATFREESDKVRLQVKGILEECEDLLDRGERARRSAAAAASKKARNGAVEQPQVPLDRASLLAAARRDMGGW